MKWRYETHKEKVARLGKWTRYFAWYPVYIDGTAVWLTHYEAAAQYWEWPVNVWFWSYRIPAATPSE